VVTAGADASVTVTAVTGGSQATFHCPGRAANLGLAVARDGTTAFLATEQSAVWRMDLQGGSDAVATGSPPPVPDTTPTPTPPKPATVAPKWTATSATPFHSLAVAGNGRLVTGGHDRTVRVWEPGGAAGGSFPNMTAAEQHVGVTRDGGTILVGGSSQETVGRLVVGNDCLLRTVSLKGNRVVRVGLHLGPITALAISANGRYALSGSQNVVRYWDALGAREIRQYFGHTSTIRSVDFHPKLAQAVSLAADNTVRAWDLNGTKLLRTITGLPGIPVHVEFSPDGKSLLVAGLHLVGVWDAATGRQQRTFDAPGPTCAAGWTPNGNVIVAVAGGMTLRSIEDGRELLRFSDPPAAVAAVVVAPDGRSVAAAGRGLAVWEPDPPLAAADAPDTGATGR
jgi:WD40 repeat protein